jgi:hypothetical protein
MGLEEENIVDLKILLYASLKPRKVKNALEDICLWHKVSSRDLQ